MGRKPRNAPAEGAESLFASLDPPPLPAAPPAGKKRRAALPFCSSAAEAAALLPAGAILAEVVLEKGAPQPLLYLADPAQARALVPGVRVLAPCGSRAVTAFFLGARAPEDLVREKLHPLRLRPLLRVLRKPGAPPPLTPDLLGLARWLARQYACDLGTVLAGMLPAGVKREAAAARTRLVAAARPEEELLRQAAALAPRAPRQAALLQALLAAGGSSPASTLLAFTRAPHSALTALARQGLVVLSVKPLLSLGQSFGGASALPPPPQLTSAQTQVLAELYPALDSGETRTFLLHGVTGSGKTEIYLRALEHVLERGRQGLVLVPEIALTPQIAHRFEARLGRFGVAVLHSQLTDGERAEAWREARAGRLGVIIGARSALFAPLERLACVVVDEEHEGSYKQDKAPRYHARAAAAERARAAAAVLLLGSATPALESWHAALSGSCRLLRLPERVGGQVLPTMRLVDLRQENRETKRYSYLSRALTAALAETLARREQAILFINRRGFATVITCGHCGATEHCERCDIALTNHRATDRLSCHYCGFEKAVPLVCSTCGQPGLKFWGMGTERVLQETQRLFPNARLARLDSDAMTRREAYLETLSAFRAGRLDALVGTQMIAKGLDFPNVTLVGIVLADTSLHLPDFRARERTFQLLEQVAGRAGRSAKGGQVIVQTHLPGDPAIRAALAHDYEGFVEAELQERRAFGYPPFRRLARVLIRGREVRTTALAAERAAEALREESRGGDIAILGPAAAPQSRLDNLQRFHLLLKAPPTGEALADLFAGPAGAVLRKLKGAEAVVDVDPLAML